ncbi:MAG TPA: hypothetical protein VKB31_01120 [Trueperaceae bacterium]|nr:hypothetical protein [Trueperaceae bacterium]
MALLRRLSPLLLVPVLLAACAPAASGTAPSSAYPITSQSIATTPGGTLYVQAHYTFADFGIDPTTITGMMWVPSGYNSDVAVFTTKFDLSNVQVPQGWSLSLLQVQASRTTVEGARTIDKSSTDYTLTALLQVRAKPGAVPGPYHLRATLSYQKQTKPLRVDLTVER